MTVTAALPTMLAFDVEVVDVRRLGPSMVRVTFGGGCLSRFGDGGPLGPRDLRVKLMFPAPGTTLPDLTDLSPGWYQRWLALDPSVRGSMRTYTVRAARVDGRDPQIDIDFVLHGEGGHAGPGSGWAARATVGQRLTVLGPHAGATAYGGIEWQPPTPFARETPAPVRVVLAGDETALPAIGSILATLPRGYAGHALVEVPSAADVLDIDGGAVEVRWLPRDGRARGELLRAALVEVMGGHVGAPAVPSDAGVADGADDAADLAEVDVDREILWETPAPAPAQQAPARQAPAQQAPAQQAPGHQVAAPSYVWVAGEASVVRDLRRLLVRDLGVDRSRVAFMGYWRAGRAEPS